MLNRICCFAILAALAAPGAALFAQSDAVKRDLKYSSMLNDLGLHDFSTRFLTERMNEQTGDKNAIGFYRVQLANTYLVSGKTDEARTIIDGIPKSDPAYYNSLGALGIYFFMRKDNAAALKPLEELYRHLKDRKLEPADYERPLTALWNIYTQEGDERKAEELMNWIAGSNSDARSNKFTKAKALLDTAENSRRAEILEKEEFQRRVDAAKKDKNKQTRIASLQKKIVELTKAVVDNPGDRNKQMERMDAYKQLGGLIDMDLERLMRIDEMDLARKKTSGEVRNRDKWNDGDKKRLRKVDDNDWQTAVLAAAVDFHEIQWGGQDMTTARATAQIIHCFYLLGEYKEAGDEVRRYPDLFDASDEVLEKDGRKNESPAADAKFWTGRSYLAWAEQTEAAAAEARAKGDRKGEAELKEKAVIYDRRAFKYLGKLVKYYPQFSEAPTAYRLFQRATEKAKEIDSENRATYQNEFSKVKAPEFTADQSTLISAWAEQNYANKQYNLVVDELLPVLRKTELRYTPAVSELLNRLMLSCAYMGDSTNTVILGSYAALLPKDDFITIGLLNSGHILWKMASEASAPDKAAQLKDDALTLYRLLLECDMLNPYADKVALRVAREHLNSASRIGARLNASKDNTERAVLKKQWLSEVEKAATAYKLIMENFGSSDCIDEAYMKYADCLAIRDDYEGAANVLRKYLAFGPSSPARAAVIQEIIPEMLSREADALAAQASETLAKAADTDNPILREKADELKKEAREQYNEVVEGILAFRQELEKGGKYESVASDPDVQKVIRRADSLLPWMYYGAEQMKTDQEEKSWSRTIDTLKEFVQKYPDDPGAPKCLMHLSSIYMNEGRESEAEEFLRALINRYPDSPEAKNGRFELAKTLFNKGNYDKSIELFGKFSLESRDRTFSIPDLRWIASNLSQCPDDSCAEQAARIALSACNKLLMEIQDPNLEDWFKDDPNDDMSLSRLKANPAEAKNAVNRLEQRIYLEAGIAAMKAGEFDLAVENLNNIDKIETDQDYLFFDKRFAMAEVRNRQGRYDDERAELAKIATTANNAAVTVSNGSKDRAMVLRRKYSDLYNKAQVLIGESYLKSEAYNRAYACFSIIAAAAPDPDSADAPGSDAETAALPDVDATWIEQAVFRTAYTAALLGKTEERDRMVRIYQKNYPDGDYSGAIRSLPQPMAQ